MSVQIRSPKSHLVASQDTWIEGEALRQLDETSKMAGMKLVVGMPDLHPGKGSPVGAAFYSDIIYPNLVGSDIGCGMGLWLTDYASRKAKPEKLAEKMNGLDHPWDGDVVAWLEEREIQRTDYDSSLGTPGRGNHFIELQKVTEVHDGALFEELGLDKDYLHVIVHSGSRGFGESILTNYAAQYGANAAQAEVATDYMLKHNHAVNWASANRALCAHRALACIGADGKKIIDVCHNLVEPHCNCWLHRKGAVPSDRGPVVIPGSRGDLTYLVQPVDGREDVLLSLAHGAGRKLARHEAKGKLKSRYRREDLERNKYGGRIVCGDELLLWEEAPECYKNISDVISDLQTTGLLSVIASFQPIVTFKTSKNEREQSEKDWKKERQTSRDAKHKW